MTKIIFFTDGNVIRGFSISGHTGFANVGYDIVCASVSSAAYMTANTITDVMNLNSDIQVSDGYMMLMLSSKEAVEAQTILKGFKIHIALLESEYGKYIKVKNSEVRNA